MKRKIVGILVCMLLIVTAVPVTGQIKEIFIGENNDFSENTDAIISPLSDDRWTKTFGGKDYDIGRSIQQTSDNGYIIVGSTKTYGVGDADIWLIKTDVNGNEEWNNTFGGSKTDYGCDVEQTTDGGYIIVGRESYNNCWLIKTDVNGNKEWDKIFLKWELYRVHQTTDEGFIMVGETAISPPQDYDILLLKVDKDGNEMWNKNFGGSGYEVGSSVVQTSDGGYILTGGRYLIKTDGNGLEEWILEFDSNMEGRDVLQNSDGGYTVAGFKGNWPTNMTGWMIITNSNGEILYSKKYRGLFTSNRPNSIYQTSDGGYIMTGESNREFPGGPLTMKLWLAKTDKFGRLIWSKRYGREYEYGAKVQQTIDGGYIVVGGTNFFGQGSVDVWLIKTDKFGITKQQIIYTLFLRFLEQHPNMFPILRQLLEL